MKRDEESHTEKKQSVEGANECIRTQILKAESQDQRQIQSENTRVRKRITCTVDTVNSRRPRLENGCLRVQNVGSVGSAEGKEVQLDEAWVRQNVRRAVGFLRERKFRALNREERRHNQREKFLRPTDESQDEQLHAEVGEGTIHQQMALTAVENAHQMISKTPIVFIKTEKESRETNLEEPELLAEFIKTEEESEEWIPEVPVPVAKCVKIERELDEIEGEIPDPEAVFVDTLQHLDEDTPASQSVAETLGEEIPQLNFEGEHLTCDVTHSQIKADLLPEVGNPGTAAESTINTCDLDTEIPAPLAVFIKTEQIPEEDSNQECTESADNSDMELDVTTEAVEDETLHCFDCNITFLNGNAFDKHKERCKPEPYTGKKIKKKKHFCNICGHFLATAWSLKGHKAVIHYNYSSSPSEEQDCYDISIEYASPAHVRAIRRKKHARQLRVWDEPTDFVRHLRRQLSSALHAPPIPSHHNDRKERSRPKTVAERMRAYRARKRAERPEKKKPKTSTERVREFRARKRQQLELNQLHLSAKRQRKTNTIRKSQSPSQQR